MRILFIGGTGLISTAVTHHLLDNGHELYLLNRGNHRAAESKGVKTLTADIRNPEAVRAALGPLTFDTVTNWIAFSPEHIRQDVELFRGRTKQYVFISSASAYEKPCRHYQITESTPLRNPYWKYSRDKIACERLLEEEYEATGFPYTVVRPSHTYGQGRLPFAVNQSSCDWTLIDRMLRGEPMLVHGDGTSLWTVTHNTDFAAAFTGVLGRPCAIGQAYHITSDEVQTWNNIYKTYGYALGVEPRLVYVPSTVIEAHTPVYAGTLLGDKAESVVFDNRKIKALVPDWACKVPLVEGARRALAWYEARPEERRVDERYNASIDRLIADCVPKF